MKAIWLVEQRNLQHDPQISFNPVKCFRINEKGFRVGKQRQMTGIAVENPY